MKILMIAGWIISMGSVGIMCTIFALDAIRGEYNHDNYMILFGVMGLCGCLLMVSGGLGLCG